MSAAIERRNAYITLAKVSGCKPGAMVKVLRTYKDDELDCNIYWNGFTDEQESFVGQVFAVEDFYEYSGEVYLENGCCYPFFALEVVTASNEFKLNDDYTAILSEDGKTIEVGCQTFDVGLVEELLEAANTQRQAYENAEKERVRLAAAKKEAKKSTKKAAKRKK